MTQETRVARIPFSGFYYSSHDGKLDEALLLMFGDDECEPTPAHEIAFDAVEWREVWLAYAQEYVSNLADECDANWQFTRLVSPREYNFATDEIDVEISLKELRRMYRELTAHGWQSFRNLVSERLAPRDGFIPFYSNVVEKWGALDEWESPQISLMVESYCNLHCSDEWRAWDCVDDCNGEVSQMIESAIPQSAWDKINELEGVMA